MNKLVILGAGLFAEDAADTVRHAGGFDLLGFVEGLDRERCGRLLLGLPVFWHEDPDWLGKDVLAIAAIGSPKRRGLVEQVASLGIKFATVVHPSAYLAEGVVRGRGTMVGPGTMIAAGTVFDGQALVNRGVMIGHHVYIEKYVTISPGTSIAGRVRIGEGSFIGMGAIILDGITIGKNSVVGAGALVTKDVPDNVQVMGLPARIVKSLDNTP